MLSFFIAGAVMRSLIILIFILTSFGENFYSQSKDALKVITLNVWSGLDYEGIFYMGEYESDEVKEQRFNLLVQNLRKVNPDVIFLQEVNPAGAYSGRLADSLGMDELHQVANGGIKLGPLGLPVNLKEGNAILAKKEYKLEEKDILKLSGSFGLYGDPITIHFDESIFALSALIEIDSTRILLVNTHLFSPSTEEGKIRRKEDIKELLGYINDYSNDMPVILGGDLNAVPESEEVNMLLSEGKFIDCFSKNAVPGYTWDPQTNNNIKYSLIKDSSDHAGLKEAEYDSVPRRVDYIFVNTKFGSSSIITSEVVLKDISNGINISDHFGVMTELNISNLNKKHQEYNLSKWEGLPILSYDSDIGFGYGLKTFLLSQLELKESFDITLFNSTKGERWYRFVFSLPDFEIRQRTVYPVGLDFIMEYDRLKKNSYFGTGSISKFNAREFFTSELIEMKIQMSRGFSPWFVAQAGFKFNSIRNFNFEENSNLHALGGLNTSTSRYYGMFANIRYDTRNSFINPSKGVVLQVEVLYAPILSINNVSFEKVSLTAQYYYKLFYPTTILAARLQLQGLAGRDIPVQNLISLGGNSTLRGCPLNRFLDKVSALANIELRFPIYWRFGGIAGMDAGNVWHETGIMSFKDWRFSSSIGLRFYMDTFIVRLDMGFSPETTGIYMNFGHIF